MARRANPDQLTPLELEIMKTLWELGPSSVQAVQEQLAPTRELAYNSVQTMLNVLLKKGKVRREAQGRAFVYESLVSQPQAARLAAADLISRMFDGSAENLVLSLVESRQLTPETLTRLTTMLEESEAETAGDPREEERHEDR